MLVELDFRAHEDPTFDSTTMSISLRTESEAVAIVDSRFFYNDQQYPFEDFPGLLTAGTMMYEDVNLETHLVPIPGSTNPGIKDLPSSISTSVPLELFWNGPPIGEHDTVAVTILDRGLRVATSETSDPGATSVTFLPDELAMIGSDSITIRVTRTTVTPFEGPGGGEITVNEYGFEQSVRVE